VIRTLVVDDHPAVQRGLVAALRAEPGLIPVATASGMTAALAEAERSRPDVVVADFHLAEGNGLALCHELKLAPSPPAVLVYSAFAGPRVLLAAAVAGADGMLDKGGPLEELFAALRTVAGGRKSLPPLQPSAVERMVTRLGPDDLPILGMRMDGATVPEIASVLRLDERELSHRVLAMLDRLAGSVRPAVGA
jgi:DNA-binding NarL/FixJ family response regulator